MDLQRNILIVALLAVSYFLFLSWQQDYSQKPPAAEAMVTPAVSAATVTETGPVAAAGGPASSTEGDLAGAAPATSATTVTDVPTTAQNGGDRIRVKTDVMDLAISLKGGDVVDLALLKYPMSLEEKDRPVRLMTSGNSVFEAQSILVATRGPAVDSSAGRAVYTADAVEYTLADGAETLEVVLHLPETNGVSVDKVYRFKRGDYYVNVFWRIRNNSPEPWHGYMFGQIKRDGSADPLHPGGGGFFSASPTYLGAAYYNAEKIYNKATFDDMREAPVVLTVTGGWVAFIQHYFVSAWVPGQQDINAIKLEYSATESVYRLRATSPEKIVAPGTSLEIGAGLYAGPKQQDRLKEISSGLELTVDYGWFWMISQFLFWVLAHIEAICGNWGVAIILLTVLVKILFYYPSHISYRSMANMRRITPELMRLRETYKNDRQKQAQEMMNLYRKEKVNPLGGCLPILIQMPVFIALYWVLLESVELRQAPFMLWIQDLSVMDPYFILPILMGISMWVQMKLNPAPPDPMQAKIMQWLPWIFTIFFLFFASGLVLYWLVNNLLSIAQQWYITRQVEKEHARA